MKVHAATLLDLVREVAIRCGQTGNHDALEIVQQLADALDLEVDVEQLAPKGEED